MVGCEEVGMNMITKHSSSSDKDIRSVKLVSNKNKEFVLHLYLVTPKLMKIQVPLYQCMSETVKPK